MGFPSEMFDDPILLLLLGDPEKFPNSEERRLFYVALTRAKVKTSLISNNKFTSKFILELEGDDVISKSKKCPRCKSGDLILKKGITEKSGKEWAFYCCTNYASYGCDYKWWV